MFGKINVGDEIIAYSNGNVIGATRIMNTNESVVLTAWGNLDKFNIESSGFISGDNIELRLWRAEDNSELSINEMFDNSKYGESVYSMGKIEVVESLDIPEHFSRLYMVLVTNVGTPAVTIHQIGKLDTR